MTKEPTGRPTIVQVADDADVSIATVSRVLNGNNTVSEERAQRVRDSIRKLGYRPNRTARNLRSHVATQKLGMILSDSPNAFFTNILHGVQSTAIQHDNVLMVGHSAHDPQLEQLHYNLMRDEGVAGIVIHFGSINPGDYMHLLDGEIPLVAIDFVAEGIPIDSVTINNLGAVKKATQHLIGVGHRRIGFISGDINIPTAIDRRNGYLEALRDAGLPMDEELIQGEDYLVESGYNAMDTLLGLGTPPTAVVASNDMTTIGALQAIRDQRLTIPDDIAIIGFDEMPWTSAFNPPLTVIDQHPYHIGVVAAEQLLTRLNDPTRPVHQIVLEADLIVRESCGADRNRSTVG